jgi:hypothetical protein
VEIESKSVTSNNRGDWNHFKITLTVPQQHTKKAQTTETTKAATLGTAHILRRVLM